MFASRPLRTLALVAGMLLVASCATDPTTGPDAATVAVPTPDSAAQVGFGGVEINNSLFDGLLKGVLICKPQPYAATTQLVGVEGGTIKVGRHTLVIPAGALSSPVQIKAESPTDAASSVRFSPEGLQFNAGHSPTLTLDYSNCPAGRLNVLKHVAYTTERLKVVTRLLSLDNLLNMQISAPIEHFSRYAVAW